MAIKHVTKVQDSEEKKSINNLTTFMRYNPGQNMWHKVKKYSKVGQDFKNLISNFLCFLSNFQVCCTRYQVLFLL